jgi:hypothetical protein
MPRHDTPSSPSPAGGMSRRSVIRGAATAGAAGLAVTALGGALSPAAAAAANRPVPAGAPAPAGAGAAAPAGAGAPAGPIVVHVRNAKSGDIEVFSGTSQTRLRDTDLTARIVRAIG